jgi:FeS assembly SUF system protein
MDATEARALHDKIVADVLRNIYDPEIPVNIYDLGLIYDLKVEESGEVRVQMTLTAPACPVAGWLVMEVQEKIKQLPGVKDVKVELVWDPPWDMSRMSEAGKLQLGIL